MPSFWACQPLGIKSGLKWRCKLDTGPCIRWAEFQEQRGGGQGPGLGVRSRCVFWRARALELSVDTCDYFQESDTAAQGLDYQECNLGCGRESASSLKSKRVPCSSSWADSLLCWTEDGAPFNGSWDQGEAPEQRS